MDDKKKSSGRAKAEKIVASVAAELSNPASRTHSPRLEYLLGLLHLASTYANAGQVDAKSRPLMMTIDELGTNDLNAPTESSAPLAYFVSYPRSGNTLATRLTANATLGQIFSATGGRITYFSKRIYPKHYPYCRLIKDHAVMPHYADDRCVLIVRDGRDTMISLAFMTAGGGSHSFQRKEDLADFIKWTAKSYKFGSWAAHARKVLDIADRPEKLLVRYEELNTQLSTFVELIDFFDVGHGHSPEKLERIYSKREQSIESIKANPETNSKWGYGHEFDPDSMYYEWSRARGGSSWRESWDAAAKRAFHETGATELLMELGYETDPDWWRS